jgi:hypothetical protein
LPYFQAYTDDTESEQGDQRLYLAGYLNREAAWTLFNLAWKEELATAPSIDYLKMSEANAFVGQFHGWTVAARDEKLRGLTRIIRHFKPLSFEVSVSREKYYRDVKPVAPRGLANPHFTCTLGVIFGVVRYVANNKDAMPIAFIFDEQTGVSDDLALFFDHMKLSLPSAARNLIKGSPIYGDDKQYLPLQAADMLAWHLRRERDAGGPLGSLPATNSLLGGSGHLVSEITESNIRVWSEGFGELPTAEMQGPKQWRNLKGEIVRQLSLGYVPPHGTRWKNALYSARDWIGKALGK